MPILPDPDLPLSDRPPPTSVPEVEARSVADVEGPWAEPEFESSLIARCRANWSVPVIEISNYALATFVRQRRGLSLALPEAKRRLATQFIDGTELYDEELSEAVAEATDA